MILGTCRRGHEFVIKIFITLGLGLPRCFPLCFMLNARTSAEVSSSRNISWRMRFHQSPNLCVHDWPNRTLKKVKSSADVNPVKKIKEFYQLRILIYRQVLFLTKSCKVRISFLNRDSTGTYELPDQGRKFRTRIRQKGPDPDHQHCWPTKPLFGRHSGILSLNFKIFV